VKDGYTFNIVNCTKDTVNNGDQITAMRWYRGSAGVGKTGNRGFCMDEFNEINGRSDRAATAPAGCAVIGFRAERAAGLRPSFFLAYLLLFLAALCSAAICSAGLGQAPCAPRLGA
jgi:hypothetical protein